jgi:uncharacterized FAD-dependent dehydrogenase
MDQNVYDVLIVGAGPAGLATAFGLATKTKLSVVLIDSGPDVEYRNQSRLRLGHSSPHLVAGVGGAGLYSDGKLCLSLGVGGDLGGIISPVESEQLLREVCELLEVPLDVNMSFDGPTKVGDEHILASRIGLEYTYYPVVHIGTDLCKLKIVRIRDRLRRVGVTILPRVSLTELTAGDQGFHAEVIGGGASRAILARRVVLAMGKVGANLERTLCRSLGATSSPRAMYVGVRVEVDAADAAEIFLPDEDAKYKLYFEDGSKVKTHCATAGGEILPLYYEGLPIAGGHAYSDHSSERTSFGVLWDGVRRCNNAYSHAIDIMRISAGITRQRLLVQRLADYERKIPSVPSSITKANPTTPVWAAGDLRSVLPANYFSHFDRFLVAMRRLGLKLDPMTTLLYGPAIEWWAERLNTNRDLQINDVPGLYVAGDGSGWSQGIVHAAATGLIVAHSIARDVTWTGSST